MLRTVYLLQIVTGTANENGDNSESEESDSDDDTVLGDTHMSDSSDNEPPESEDNEEAEFQDRDDDNVEQLFSVTRSGRMATTWRAVDYGFF